MQTPTGIEMTEADAKAKWEARWKAEWEKSQSPKQSVMTEDEAKAKWEAKWKAGWKKSLPQAPSAMTEAEAKAKWDAQWKSEWETAYRQKLRASFEKRLGGNQHIADFKREIVKIVPHYNKPGFAQERQVVCATLEAYVSFLEEIINQQPQNKER